MACPHVSGEAALILSQNPSLTNQQLRDLIIGNVDPYNPINGHTIAPGGGRINAYKALQQAGTPGIPPAPTNLTAASGDQTAILSWQASLGATSYNVYRGTTTGGPYSLVGSAPSSPFTDTGLTNGNPYFYVVTAVNPSGESGFSNEASATPQAAPTAPSNLQATKQFKNEIDLAWTDNSSNETAFEVEISKDGSFFSNYGTVGPNVTTFAATGLARRTVFWFRVRAVWAGGYSAYSNVISAKTRG
jgi:fibronectin type 3 domain-containing protein